MLNGLSPSNLLGGPCRTRRHAEYARFRVAQDFVAKSLQGATVVAIQNTLTQEGRTFSFGTSARDEACAQRTFLDTLGCPYGV